MVVNRTGFFLESSARIIGVMVGGFNLLATAIWINIDTVGVMFIAVLAEDLAKNPRSPAFCGLVIPRHYIVCSPERYLMCPKIPSSSSNEL